MIISFGDKATEDLFHGASSSKVHKLPTDILKVAVRKFDTLNSVKNISDLRVPPSNRLEALAGDLRGYHSIRVNDQFRLIFRWNEGAHEVRLTDYH